MREPIGPPPPAMRKLKAAQRIDATRFCRHLPEPGYTSVFSPVQCRFAPVAQWIEYWPPKPRVAGSIPAGRATCDIDSAIHSTSLTYPVRLFCFLRSAVFTDCPGNDAVAQPAGVLAPVAVREPQVLRETVASMDVGRCSTDAGISVRGRPVAGSLFSLPRGARGMTRTRNISKGVTPALHAQCAALGLDARRNVPGVRRIWLAQRLTAGAAEIGQDDAATRTDGPRRSAVRSGAARPAALAEGQTMEHGADRPAGRLVAPAPPDTPMACCRAQHISRTK